MPIIATAIAAGTILAVLAALLTLAAIAIRAEDHRARGILGPPPGHLADATRRMTGLHVRRPAPDAIRTEAAAPSAALHAGGRWDC